MSKIKTVKTGVDLNQFALPANAKEALIVSTSEKIAKYASKKSLPYWGEYLLMTVNFEPLTGKKMLKLLKDETKMKVFFCNGISTDDKKTKTATLNFDAYCGVLTISTEDENESYYNPPTNWHDDRVEYTKQILKIWYRLQRLSKPKNYR